MTGPDPAPAGECACGRRSRSGAAFHSDRTHRLVPSGHVRGQTPANGRRGLDSHAAEVGKPGRLDLNEEVGDVDASMLRCIRAQAALRLLELALAADAIAASRLVPGDGDVNEALVEVTLLRRGRAPDVLQNLVSGEVLAPADQLEPALEVRGRPSPRRPRPRPRTSRARVRDRTRSRPSARRTASRARGM